MSNKADAAQDALSDMRAGLESAKKLVERTRLLLRGETPYDEGELRMSEAADEGHPSPTAPSALPRPAA